MEEFKLTNHNNERQRYISCHDLERGLIAYSDGIQHCCHLGDRSINTNKMLYADYTDMDELLDSFVQQKKQIIEDNKKGKKTMCSNCKQHKEGYWPQNKLIESINLSFDSVCNLKCKYCYKVEDDYKQAPQVDTLGFFTKLKESRFVDIKYPILYSSGEITIQPNVNNILHALADYDVCFFTNATRYNKNLLDVVKRFRNCLVISLDCGTKETYKHIKGVDLFNTVCENIMEYTRNGGNVILKYIIMEDNSNIEDIDRFIDLCIDSKIQTIQISTDFGKMNKNKRVIKMATQLAYRAQRNNIKYYTQGVYEMYSAVFGIDFNYI